MRTRPSSETRPRGSRPPPPALMQVEAKCLIQIPRRPQNPCPSFVETILVCVLPWYCTAPLATTAAIPSIRCSLWHWLGRWPRRTTRGGAAKAASHRRLCRTPNVCYESGHNSSYEALAPGQDIHLAACSWWGRRPKCSTHWCARYSLLQVQARWEALSLLPIGCCGWRPLQSGWPGTAAKCRLWKTRQQSLQWGATKDPPTWSRWTTAALPHEALWPSGHGARPLPATRRLKSVDARTNARVWAQILSHAICYFTEGCRRRHFSNCMD